MSDSTASSKLKSNGERYSSRKFIIAVGTIVGCGLLLLTGKLTGDNFVAVIQAALLFYIGGNVAQRYAEK